MKSCRAPRRWIGLALLLLGMAYLPSAAAVLDEQQKLIADEGAASDLFGTVAIDGETAIVGAYGDDALQGSAYVYVRSGTTWALQQKLTASDGAADDWFGISVAISGDTAIVGAPNAGDVGATYVYVRSGTTWTLQQKLTASDGASADSFGYSVAISGGTVIVGAYADNFLQGSAYIFVRSGTTWTEQQKLTASDGVSPDVFGISVAISGETAIVGARQEGISACPGPNACQGSAYVYVRSGTSWTQQQKLIASDRAASDFFGHSVAISGETALVGAYSDDRAAGSAYVYVRSGTTWTQQQKLTASDRAVDDFFGVSVAIDGETALVGAYKDDVAANADQGSAYVYARSGTTWTEQQKLTASDGAGGDWFGVSVAISGETAIVGALNDDVGSTADQGSAYVYASARVDLRLSKIDTPDPVVLGGGTLAYQLGVKNVSATLARAVTIVDTLPAGADFVSADSDCSYDGDDHTVTCDLGDLAGGASTARQVVVEPTVAGTLTNTATVSATEVDSNPASNTKTITTRVIGLKSIKLPSAAAAGGCPSQGTVYLTSKAPAGGLEIDLGSTNSAATPVEPFMVPGGKSSAPFTIETELVSLTLSGDISGTLNGNSVSAPISVRRFGVKTLTLSQSTVVGGSAVTATVTLDCAVPEEHGDASVTVTSNKPSVAQPQSPVIVAVGDVNGDSVVTTFPVGASTNARITATLNGIFKRATLTVTP